MGWLVLADMVVGVQEEGVGPQQKRRPAKRMDDLPSWLWLKGHSQQPESGLHQLAFCIAEFARGELSLQVVLLHTREAVPSLASFYLSASSA